MDGGEASFGVPGIPHLHKFLLPRVQGKSGATHSGAILFRLNLHLCLGGDWGTRGGVGWTPHPGYDVPPPNGPQRYEADRGEAHSGNTCAPSPPPTRVAIPWTPLSFCDVRGAAATIGSSVCCVPRQQSCLLSIARPLTRGFPPPSPQVAVPVCDHPVWHPIRGCHAVVWSAKTPHPTRRSLFGRCIAKVHLIFAKRAAG